MLCLFLFQIDYTIYANHVFIKKKQYLSRDIELIKRYIVIWIPSVLTLFSLRGEISTVKLYRINKTRFVSFFVYMYHFRISVNNITGTHHVSTLWSSNIFNNNLISCVYLFITSVSRTCATMHSLVWSHICYFWNNKTEIERWQCRWDHTFSFQFSYCTLIVCKLLYVFNYCRSKIKCHLKNRHT